VKIKKIVREKFKWKLYLAAPQKMIHVRYDHKNISPDVDDMRQNPQPL